MTAARQTTHGAAAHRATDDSLRRRDLVPVDDRIGDRFFRHLVFNLRTGVLAITESGQVAAMNDLAYRVLGLNSRPGDIGRPFMEVLQDCPEVCRVLQEAFESDDLPNRAEMRLRKTGRAIGYTLSRIYDDTSALVGATLFFKDLTRVVVDAGERVRSEEHTSELQSHVNLVCRLLLEK